MLSKAEYANNLQSANKLTELEQKIQSNATSLGNVAFYL